MALKYKGIIGAPSIREQGVASSNLAAPTTLRSMTYMPFRPLRSDAPEGWHSDARLLLLPTPQKPPAPVSLRPSPGFPERGPHRANTRPPGASRARPPARRRIAQASDLVAGRLQPQALRHGG